ncbi:MAG: carbohydrate kinase family protein [Atopobiaceae bacterium]|nr:carbohydrate kinase family protein [Atopobiaceae bacterium]
MGIGHGNGIIVIGTTFVDIKGYPFSEFIPAGRNAGRIIEVHGGVSRNIAEDIANIGLPCTYISTVDESGIGAGVISRLDERGCNTAHMRAVEDGLGTWLAVFDHTGDGVASISKRPRTDEIARILDEEGDEIFATADSVAVEFDIDEDILIRILSLAAKHGKKVYSPITNMSIAAERRNLMNRIECLVCNQQEAGMLFAEDYEGASPQGLIGILADRISVHRIKSMVVTMGAKGAVYVSSDGTRGRCYARDVDVVDTTGAGDAFFAGVVSGLTYGKTLGEACEIGTRIASEVIATDENVCPRIAPAELGL